MAALLATLLSGALYAASFPERRLAALAWIALVPWLVALRRGSAARALLLAWIWSLAAAWGLNAWFPRAVSTYYLQPAWVGAAFFVGVTTLTAAPAFAAFTLVWRRLPASGLPTPLLAAAAWVAAELGRTRLLGDPWGLLGYSQAATRILLQVAEVTGVYGTSFALAAVNAALAALWLARGTPGARAARRGLAGALAVACLVAAYGVVRVRAIERQAPMPTVPVAVVQANLDLGSQWRPEFYGRNLEAYLRLTARALDEVPRPRLVVWPESAMTFFLDDEPTYRAAIALVLAPSGAALVTGGPRTAAGTAPRYHNAAFLLTPSGEIAGWYDKRQLLPFAERFPVRGLDVLRRSFGRVREFTPGAPTAPLATPAGRAGVVVCNEALFAAPARERVRAGAEVLLALTNDSWVGDPTFAAQALDMTIVRAVETRRWLVRASTSGPSVVVAPTGRVTAKAAHDTAAVLHTTMAPASGLTPYARAGDAFAVLCTLAAVLGCVLSARRPRRAGPASSS
jgi:apolipoprotein N-acyltransferase